MASHIASIARGHQTAISTRILVVVKDFTFSACPGLVRGRLVGQHPAGDPFEELAAVETLRSLWKTKVNNMLKK